MGTQKTYLTHEKHFLAKLCCKIWQIICIGVCVCVCLLFDRRVSWLAYIIEEQKRFSNISLSIEY